MKRRVVPFVFAAAMVAAVCLGGCGNGLTEVEAAEPTCTEAGHTAYYTDGEKYYSDSEGKNEILPESVEIDALGHKYSPSYNWNGTEATVTLTCERDYSHTRTEAMTVTSETEDAICADGKTVYTATLIIDSKEYKDVKEVALPATEEHSLSADYESSATEHWQVCEVCETEVKKEAHAFEWKTDKQAGETEAGVRHEECTVCGYKRNEGTVIPPTGSGLTFVAANTPTCNTAGNTAYYTDGAKYYSDALGTSEITLESTVIPATNQHTPSTGYTTSATEHWKVCTACATKLGTDGHSFEWKTDKEASATETGLKHEECTVCDYRRNENTVIPSTGGQKVIVSVPAKDPTCTEKGNTAYYTDGDKYYSDAEGNNEITKTSVEIPASGHNYGNPVTPVFTWSGYSSAIAKITCTRANCGHEEQALATITSEVTTSATCASGVKTYTAKATLNGVEYTDTQEETLAATAQHVIISKCGLDENDEVTYYKACKNCSYIQETLPHDHYADRKVTVNGTEYTPYTCYNPVADTFVTYDVINQLFVIHLSGNVGDGLTIAASNNEVAISVDDDATIPSVTFTNGFRQLTVMGGGKLTVTGKFSSNAQSTTIDCDVTFNGGLETLTQLLVIRSGNVVVNGSLKSSACNITVGTADNSTQPTFTVNSTSNDGGIVDGDYGRALNLQFLSGTVNINQTGSGNVGISCNTANSTITVGGHATLNIQGFAIGIRAWNSAANNATLNGTGTINITGATQGDIKDMAGDYQH